MIKSNKYLSIVLIICSICLILPLLNSLLVNTYLSNTTNTIITQYNNKLSEISTMMNSSLQTFTCNRFEKDKCNFLISLLIGLPKQGKFRKTEQYVFDFRKTGVAHLLAVSGFNVTIIIQIVTMLFILFPHKYRVVFVIIMLTMFVLVVGLDNIPAIRAYLFGMVFLLTKYFGYLINLKRLLLYYVIFSVIINVSVINNISFLLTVGSMLGIILFQKALQKG